MMPRIVINSTDVELYGWLEYTLGAVGFAVELRHGLEDALDSDVLAVIVDCQFEGQPREECLALMNKLAGLSVPLIALVEGDDRKLHLDLIRASAERFHRPLSPRRLIDYLLSILPEHTRIPDHDRRNAKTLRFAEIQGSRLLEWCSSAW